MKFRLFKPLALVMLVTMLVATVGIGAVSADNALTLGYSVSITYLNVGTLTATVSIDFYPEGSATPINFSLPNLNAGAATSLGVGSVTDVPAGFRGSAVMSSTQQLVATVVQYHTNAAGETVKMRLLSNGFGDADGSAQFLIASVLDNNGHVTDVFSVQNIENDTITATVKIYDTTGALAGTKNWDIPAQSTKYIQMDQNDQTGLPPATTTFIGSAVVTAVMKSDGSTPGRVVVTINDYFNNKFDGASVEGIPVAKAGTKLYFSTGLCNNGKMKTAYSIQNSSLTTATNITVTYYNLDGTVKTTDGPYNILAGQKKSILTCSPNSGVDMTNWTGSAIVTSDTTAIVGIGRGSGTDPTTTNYYTAFLGEAGGYTKLALPFIRWANDADYNSPTNMSGYQRANLAIQNVSTVTAKINVKYMDKAGNVVATVPLTIPAGAKGNSNPSTAGALGKNGMVAGEFGYYTDHSFGGGVIIQLDPTSDPAARIIAIARLANPGMCEDYNAVTIP